MPAAKRRHTFSLARVLDTVAAYGDGLVSHNLRLGARRTSFRLDGLTWRSLCEMVRREGIAVPDLCAMIFTLGDECPADARACPRLHCVTPRPGSTRPPEKSGLPVPAPSAYAEASARQGARSRPSGDDPSRTIPACSPRSRWRSGPADACLAGCRRQVAKGAPLARFKGLPP
jgi:ribbon-helix-helix protein